MSAHKIMFILLLAAVPCIGASKPPRVIVTQVDEPGGRIGESKSAICDSSGCRKTIPVLFHKNACDVKMEVSLPQRGSVVHVDFSLVSCWPRRPSMDMFLDQGASGFIKLGPHRAFTKVICLDLGRAMNDFAPSEHQPSYVRIDAVYP